MLPIGNTLLLVFLQYSIPILLSSGALVNSAKHYSAWKSKNWDCRIASSYCYSACSL